MKRYFVMTVYNYRTQAGEVKAGRQSFFVEALVFSNALKKALEKFQQVTGEPEDALIQLDIQPSTAE